LSDIWPDWSGKAVAIVASGFTTKKSEVEILKGRLPVLAIKRNVELAPWADVVYGCDAAWWESVQGLPHFSGLKLCWADRVCDRYPDIHKVRIAPKDDRFLMGEIGTVGAGGNSGYQALNLSVQFGAKRILLVGFDVNDRGGTHWYGRNNWNMANNPTRDNFRRWCASFTSAAPIIEDFGVEVINASIFSDLKCFKQLSVDQALTRWGL